MAATVDITTVTMYNSQSTFTCSELTIETLEQGVKYDHSHKR